MGMIIGAVLVSIVPVSDHVRFTRYLMLALGALLCGLGFAVEVWQGISLMAGMGLISSSINVLLITRIQ